MKQFKPGDIINAHALEQMRRFRAGVWKGGSGVAANHSGSRTRLVRKDKPRSGAAIWEPYGSKGGSYTNQPRYGADITSLMRRINALEAPLIRYSNRTEFSIGNGWIRDPDGYFYAVEDVAGPGTDFDITKRDVDGSTVDTVNIAAANLSSRTCSLDIDDDENIYACYWSGGYTASHIVTLDTDLNIAADNSSATWALWRPQLSYEQTHLWGAVQPIAGASITGTHSRIVKTTPAWVIDANIDVSGWTINSKALNDVTCVSDLASGDLFVIAKFGTGGTSEHRLVLANSSGTVQDSVLLITSASLQLVSMYVRNDLAFVGGSTLGSISTEVVVFNSDLEVVATSVLENVAHTIGQIWKSPSRDEILLSAPLDNLITLPHPEGGAEFFAYPSVDVGDAVSLGTPDSGVSIPALDGIDGSEVALNYITDMRAVIESIAPAYLNSGSGDPYNWTASDSDNLYFLTFGSTYDWERDAAAMLADNTTYDVDINEIHACVTLLEASDLAW